MIAHAWHPPDAPLPGINPMLWVDCRKDAVAEAERVAPLLSEKPKGRRVLHLSWVFDIRELMHDPARLIALGLPYGQTWFAAFFRRLHELGVPRIDLLSVDHEQGISVWHWHVQAGTMPRHEAMAAIYADKTAVRQLPTSLRKLGPRLAQPALDREAIIAFNGWAHAEAARRLGDAIGDAQSRAMGYRARLCNYQCMRIDGEAFDRNGWPMLHSPVSSYSAPSLYPNGTGQLFLGMTTLRAKEADLARCLAIVDACVGTVIPWIPYPSYIGADAFRALLAGLKELGIKEVQYWNPKHERRYRQPGDDEFAAEVFGGIE